MNHFLARPEETCLYIKEKKIVILYIDRTFIFQLDYKFCKFLVFNFYYKA